MDLRIYLLKKQEIHTTRKHESMVAHDQTKRETSFSRHNILYSAA